MNFAPFLMSILWIALGYPLATQKIGPNGWYGFRTAKTLSDPEIWYSANVVAGKALMWAGGASLVTVGLLYVFWSGNSELRIGIGVMIPAIAMLTALVWSLAKT